MSLTEEDMKEFNGFYQELHVLIGKRERLNEDIQKTGFAKELMQRLTELAAEFENLNTRQHQFGRKHFLM